MNRRCLLVSFFVLLASSSSRDGSSRSSRAPTLKIASETPTGETFVNHKNERKNAPFGRRLNFLRGDLENDFAIETAEASRLDRLTNTFSDAQTNRTIFSRTAFVRFRKNFNEILSRNVEILIVSTRRVVRGLFAIL